MFEYLVITDGVIRYYPYNYLEDEEAILNAFDRLNVKSFRYFNPTKMKEEVYVVTKTSDFKFETIISIETPDYILMITNILNGFNRMLKKMSEVELTLIYESPNDVNWEEISSKTYLSEDFIREFKNKLNWDEISQIQTLSETFIAEFQDKVDWLSISFYQILSENFIRKFQDKVDWEIISMCQTLSEDFIKEFQEKVDWDSISGYQTLSENFIREFSDKVDWSEISNNCHLDLSDDFREEFEDEFKEYLIFS